MVAARAFFIVALTTVGARADLLCFGAKWCGPCREMEPTLERLHREGYPIRKFDVDAHPDLAQKYNVTSVPNFVLVDDQGTVVDRIDQATTYESLSRMLTHYRVTSGPTLVRGQSSRGPDEPTLRAVSPPPLRPVPASTGGEDAAVRAAVAATVRLRVEDEQGHSFGTGTVIDVHGQEALVLTCGHIFRDSQGKGQIQIDRFDAQTAESTTGSVISYDIDRDIGLVSMKLTRPIQQAKLAPAKTTTRESDPIFSIGCGHGEPPSVMKGRINRINKYLGPANITASGKPVDGRSGGGLFNHRGELIGVCSAADPEFDEGLYAAMPRIHDELDRNGLSFIYGELPSQEAPSTGLLAGPATREPTQTGNVVPATHQAGEGKSFEQDSEELVCVVHGGDQQGRAFVIKNPSRVLLEYLAREAERGAEARSGAE